MEDENKFTFQNSTLPTRSYDFFQSMRNDTELCDIILRVGNQSISAHRLIIAAAIPYFRASFYTKFSESEVSEVDFPDVDPSAFENLLDYAYTYKIVITTENVKNLLYAACHLHVEEVRDACCNFLIDRLRPENVLNVRHLATDVQSTVLLENAVIYARENFADVSKTEEFLNLSFSYVIELIESDELNVTNEEEVFEAVMKWVKECPEQRKGYLPKLLKAVRMPLLSPLYLKKCAGKEDLLRSSLPCRDLLDEAKDFHEDPEERSECSFSTVPRCCCKTPSESAALNKEAIYALYGKHVYTVKYLQNTRKVWNEKATNTFSYLGTSTTVVGDKLYLLRGCDVFSYDPLSDIFTRCPVMPSGRIFSGAAPFSNKMYVCGGTNDFLASDIVECYDPETNKWEKIANMRERRQEPGVATLGKHIYVSGGCYDSTVHKTVEKYETREGRWRFVQPMLCERYGQGFTALSGRLYACGGRDSDLKCTTSAEVFDPVKNKWSFIAAMNNARYGFKLLPYCGELYAIGGLDAQLKELETVEIYDPRTDEWRTGDSVDPNFFVSAEVMTSLTAAEIHDEVELLKSLAIRRNKEVAGRIRKDLMLLREELMRQHLRPKARGKKD